MTSGAGRFTERVMILTRTLATADGTGEEVESWPTPASGTGEHWVSIEDSGGSETTDATRGSYRTLSIRFRHQVTLAAVDKVKFLDTAQIFRVMASWRERNPDSRQWETVCRLSAIGEA